MYEINYDLKKYKDYFKSFQTDFVFDSIADKITPGSLFTDDFEVPSVFMLKERWPVYYLSGEGDDKQYHKTSEFLKDTIQQYRQGMAKINYSSEKWKGALLEELKEFNPQVYKRSVFIHELSNIPVASIEDREVEIKEIDRELLESGLGNIDDLMDEICGGWGTIENFVTKGFGYCAVKDDRIICRCTSEYMSKENCGVGIETYMEYQNKGIATAAAARLVQKCSELRIKPHWDSWLNNVPSVRVAEKLGFRKLADYEVIFVRF